MNKMCLNCDMYNMRSPYFGLCAVKQYKVVFNAPACDSYINTNTLLPCPLCGKNVSTTISLAWSNIEAKIKCPNCGLEKSTLLLDNDLPTLQNSIKGFIASWNNRTPLLPPKERAKDVLNSIYGKMVSPTNCSLKAEQVRYVDTDSIHCDSEPSETHNDSERSEGNV